jgi:RNA polymerase sigma-70 factor (ECF subfamily)
MVESRGVRVTDRREERFRCIWEEHSGRVLAYVVRRLGSEREAEDIVAETFILAWRKIENVPEDPVPWLLGAARRVLSHYLRSTRGQRALRQKLDRASKTPSTCLVEDGAWATERLVAAYGSLSPADQEMLTLVDWEGLSNEQAASVVRCSASTFAVRLHRARNRLKRHLAADADDTTPAKFAIERPEEAR